MAKLCHHVDGACLDASAGKFDLIFLGILENFNDFVRKRVLKRGLEELMNKFYNSVSTEILKSSTDAQMKLSKQSKNSSVDNKAFSARRNGSLPRSETKRHDFMVRLLGLKSVLLENKEDGTQGEFVLLDGHTVIDGELVMAVLEGIPREDIEYKLAAEYYNGPLYSRPANPPAIKSHLPLIIGGSVGKYNIFYYSHLI